MSTKTVLTEEQALERYRDFLDEVYEPLRMGYIEILPSVALERSHPIDFRLGFADYVDMLAEEGELVEGWQ